jgi:hypothetical protein
VPRTWGRFRGSPGRFRVLLRGGHLVWDTVPVGRGLGGRLGRIASLGGVSSAHDGGWREARFHDEITS